jgi:FkbM family methyltransferase
MAGWWAWSEEVERQRLNVYRPFIKPGDMCFDIGANRGRKTFVMRTLGAKVVAVEPLFAFGAEFVPEFNWRWGNDRNVIPVARAVTAERQVEISINRFIPYVSSIDRAWMTTSAHAPKNGQPYYKPGSLVKRNVAGITLDGLVNIYGMPAFVKVDVEGAENSVMATLTTQIPAFNLEFHQDWIPVEAMEHMDELGPYRWTYALDFQGTFAMSGWTDRRGLLDILSKRLTEKGNGSWGDIYGRLAE